MTISVFCLTMEFGIAGENTKTFCQFQLGNWKTLLIARLNYFLQFSQINWVTKAKAVPL